jgi:hypothetical protein
LAPQWGVRVPKSTSYKTEINLLDAGSRRPEGVGSGEAARRHHQGDAVGRDDRRHHRQSRRQSAANRNAYNAANTDRLLFGKLVSNYSATWATAMGNLDTTDDKCTVAAMSLMKRIAKLADPHIRPFKSKVGQEYFVAFHGSRTFRDLKADTTMTQANRDARPRDVADNPIFQDGDMIYDGIIHREVPEIDAIAQNTGGTYSLDAVGAASADVRPVFLCGAQAVGIAWGQEPTPRTDTRKDYEFRPGVAIEELLGVKKLAFNGVQQGMVSGFFCAAADS